jgi:hypothetical protein
MQQGDFIDVFDMFRVYTPLSGALGVELQHMVFYSEFLDGWWS